MKPVLCPLIALLALAAGCATTRTNEADIKQHCDALYANPQIDPVRNKMLLPITYGTGQPIEILGDRTTPTAAERAALVAVSKAFAACNEFAADKLGPMPGYRMSSND